MISRAMQLVCAILLLGSGGCAFSDGRGFGRAEAEVGISFPALAAGSDRLTSDGWLQAANGFALRFDALRMSLHGVNIFGTLAGSQVGDSCQFDPASPPSGCGACHDGHCHCAAELVSYAELERRVCGAAAATDQALVALRFAQPIDVLAPQNSSPATRCEPDCELPRASIARVVAEIEEWELSGQLQDRGGLDRLGGKTLTVAIDQHLDLLFEVRPTVALTIDRDSGYRVRAELQIRLPAEIFDGVAWQDLVRTGESIAIDAQSNATAADALRGALSKATVDLSLIASDD